MGKPSGSSAGKFHAIRLASTPAYLNPPAPHTSASPFSFTPPFRSLLHLDADYSPRLYSLCPHHPFSTFPPSARACPSSIPTYLISTSPFRPFPSPYSFIPPFLSHPPLPHPPPHLIPLQQLPPSLTLTPSSEPSKSSSSSRDTSKSTNHTKSSSSSGGSKSSSSSSKYGKPDIHNHPDGKRDGHSEPSYKLGDGRYYKGSSLTEGYGGKR